MTTIGAFAFAGDAKLKKIAVKSAVLKKVGAKALRETNFPCGDILLFEKSLANLYQLRYTNSNKGVRIYETSIHKSSKKKKKKT